MKPVAVPIERIENRILLVRGHKVLLDTDLAMLYGVPTKRFNEQVRRNAERFPRDFMFQLSPEEWDSLRSQFATLKTGRGQHRKYLPHVFTELGGAIQTFKYRPQFPARFAGLEHARAHSREFFPWYNNEHRHSGIGFMTPAAVHFGTAPALWQQRAAVLQAAYPRIRSASRASTRRRRNCPLSSASTCRNPTPGALS